jgi:hypothetical protein
VDSQKVSSLRYLTLQTLMFSPLSMHSQLLAERDEASHDGAVDAQKALAVSTTMINALKNAEADATLVVRVLF